MSTKKQRESKFELMKIISMFMIVLWHVIIHGKLVYTTIATTNLIYNLLLSIFVVHVNSFVLVTGYFQSSNKFSLNKFLNLFFLQWFYRIVIVLSLTYLGLINLSSTQILNELLPIGSGNYWFINCYLVLYLLSPFLNKLIDALNQKDYRKLLLVSFVVFSVIPFLTNSVTVKNDGSTVIQFCFIYLIGGYLKKYPIQNNLHFKNYSKEKRQLLFIFGFIVCAMTNFLLIIFAKHLSEFSNPFIQQIASYISVSQYNFSPPVVIIQSICYFLYFETLTLNSKIINKISSIILGVYLIHDNDYVRIIIYKILKIDTGYTRGPYSLIHMLIVGIIIFISCLIIEFIRSAITKLICNTKYIKNKKEKLYSYFERI